MLSIKDYNVGMNILVNDKMQKNYSYILSKPMVLMQMILIILDLVQN